jgi:hypothetical protein
MKFKSLPIITIIACAFGAGSVVAQPANDNCSGAISLQTGIGNAFGVVTTFGPYDNTLATVNINDPIAGYECFGEPDGGGAAPTLENTMWFTFTGDGGKYFIETGTGAGVTNYIDDGDTQIAIYTGTCGALVPFACNEDGPSATATIYPAGLTFNTSPGVVYYMMVDGFNFNGAISNGQYLIFVSQQATVACNAPSVSLGTASANKTSVCPNDTVRFTITGVVTPTVGTISGLGWFISNASITGDPDPVANPAVIAGYGVQNPAPASSFRELVNDGGLIGGPVPYGTYYWTPVIFGNATVGTAPGTFMTQLVFDPACTTTGTSIPVDVLAPGTPSCSVGLTDISENGFGILNLRPVPVSNQLNFNLRTVESGSVNVVISDLAGRQILNQYVRSTPGEKVISLDVESIASGVYHLSAISGANTAIVRFVKQ